MSSGVWVSARDAAAILRVDVRTIHRRAKRHGWRTRGTRNSTEYLWDDITEDK